MTNKSDKLVEIITPLVFETMGEETAGLFHTFYELEPDEEVLSGARSLLYDFLGKDMAEKKLNKLTKNS